MPVLPCPDCGGRVPLEDPSPLTWQTCPKCGASFRPVRATLEKAVARDEARKAAARAKRDAPAEPALPPRKRRTATPGAAAPTVPRRRPKAKPPADDPDDWEDWDAAPAALPPRRERAAPMPPRRERTPPPARAKRPAAAKTPRKSESGGGGLSGMLAGGAGTVLVCALLAFKVWARYERAQNRIADRNAANVAERDRQPRLLSGEPDRPVVDHDALRINPGPAIDMERDWEPDRSGRLIVPDPVLPSHSELFPAANPHDDFFERQREESRQRQEESRRWHEEARQRNEERMNRMHNFPGGPPGFGGGFGPSGDI